jgi:hypothetical protein
MASIQRKDNQVISYLTLRTLIGFLGIGLPVLLVVANYICYSTWKVEDSISDYYNNQAAGDIFVGVLFVLGFFLLSYKGYEPVDNRTANFGCVFSLGLALFPTTSHVKFVHIMHFVFALLLFSVFIFFSLYLFRKTDKKGALNKQKKNRNRVYLICGIIMVICVLAIAAFCLINSWVIIAVQYNLIFWFETIALGTFGFSWITKGELLWQDAKN